jgi:sugar-specific transcriptional regulator TrmB
VADIDGLLRSLQATGMSGYEAKAYLALIGADGPLNGYEVAKRSGVPRSTVYETLAKLLARGAAFEVRSSDDNTAYVALPPDALIRRLRQSFETHLDQLAEELPQVAGPAHGNLLHNLEGRSAVLSRATDLIDRAEHDLYLSAWADELREFGAPLARAAARNVDTSILHFGDVPSGTAAIPGPGHAYPHVFAPPDVVLNRVGCRLFIVVADREAVLVGGAVDDSMWGVYSDDPALVLVAIEYVRHDIAFQVLARRVGLDAVNELFETDPTLLRLATGRGAPGLERRVMRS